MTPNDLAALGREVRDGNYISHDPVDAAVTPMALMFSGGKDSSACLKLLREQDLLGHACIVWVNTGDPYPETLETMRRVRSTVPHFCEVRTNVLAWQEANGIPTDLLPLSATAAGRVMNRSTVRPMVHSWTCCSANLWMPALRFLIDNRFSIAIRGEKACDVPRGPVQNLDVVAGVKFWLPLDSWSDAEVIEYLGDDLPEHYRDGANTSLDCLHCTGHWRDLFDTGALDYLRARHPEAWTEVSDRLNDIIAACDAARAAFQETVSGESKNEITQEELQEAQVNGKGTAFADTAASNAA